MEIFYAPSQFLRIMKMLLFIIYLILLINPFVFSTNHWHARLSNISDQEALLRFMAAVSTSDPSRSLSTTWKPNVSFCEWTGITCSRRRERVVSLDVSSMGLQGIISPFLGNLSFLRVLQLSNNSFHSHIPYQLGNLFRLKMLGLSSNQLEGFIPPTLGRCGHLKYLNADSNNLIGNIPAKLCDLARLQYIDLGYNNLTGTIPACWGNISSLVYIRLDKNNLHGNIPSQLGMLSLLFYISIWKNRLTGQIPSSFLNCTNLEYFSFSANRLTGHIPADLCSKNTRLLQLFLVGNQLSGSIPASLHNCTNLQVISLSRNQFSGVVPMELGKLKQLSHLLLDTNQLVSGSSTSLPILTALTNCSNLRSIGLANNRLTGSLSFSIGHLSAKMDILNLRHNQLAGEIPPHIGNLTNLTMLELQNNFFTGKIPSSINMLQKLERLFMGFNNFQGNIPNEIGQLKSLGLLNLKGSNLSGRIPDSIASLQELVYLQLAQNQLSGHIPVSLGRCVKLLLLDLSYNNLSGHIPSEIAGLSNLAFYLNLSTNLLHGPVPSELGKMTMVQGIDISANQLTGEIPSTLKSCIALEYLNLSYNVLGGPIPVSLGDGLLNLQSMDLSFNNLSGGIPMSLENLKMLQLLNLSFNQLSGEVPKGGVFKNIGAIMLMGNLGLCGSWASLPPCFTSKHKSHSYYLKRVIIPVVAVTVIVAWCLFLGILWRSQNNKKREARAFKDPGYRRISYAEIIQATDEFSDANLLGVGSFGKVYKGVLNDGIIVAIKLLNLENEEAYNSFDKECKVLSQVRHRNLIRIITSYSDMQMKALIFPFMPNGSLEQWLYPNEREESCLSLSQRLNILIDIAHGMAYLHHHCFVQVIHCDLKPKNVLLGEDMTAYIIDFGIATICFANSQHSAYTSTHALKGSIGYIPPEYGLGGHVTTKGDVYSYGILLLEMLTGKKPTHDMFVEGMNLHKWVSGGFPNGTRDVVDGSLWRYSSTSNDEEKDINCLSELLRMGLLCTKESPEERPTMMDIVDILQNIRDTLLGVASNLKYQLDISHLLCDTSTTHNNFYEGQSSSTF